MGQKIFFEGQIYDAFSLLISLVGKAEKSIVLIDNYVDVGTLNILAKKKDGVDVTIYTVPEPVWRVRILQILTASIQH